jgi:hypothetical protein
VRFSCIYNLQKHRITINRFKFGLLIKPFLFVLVYIKYRCVFLFCLCSFYHPNPKLILRALSAIGTRLPRRLTASSQRQKKESLRAGLMSRAAISHPKLILRALVAIGTTLRYSQKKKPFPLLREKGFSNIKLREQGLNKNLRISFVFFIFICFIFRLSSFISFIFRLSSFFRFFSFLSLSRFFRFSF